MTIWQMLLLAASASPAFLGVAFIANSLNCIIATAFGDRR